MDALLFPDDDWSIQLKYLLKAFSFKLATESILSIYAGVSWKAIQFSVMRSYWAFFAVIHLIPFSLRELSLYRYVCSELVL